MSEQGLVVLRAGKNSLHSSWLSDSRSWDLAISSFGHEDATAFPEAKYFEYYRGGKWDGIARFFANHPEVIENYKWFWLPDDDIDTSAETINRLFAAGAQLNAYVVQPALTRDSFFFHAITVQCPAFERRETSLVEIMVPMLSREALVEYLPKFATTRTGSGLDYDWASMARRKQRFCGIFDTITMRHTRPVGSALTPALKAAGFKSSEEELLESGFSEHRAITYAAVTRSGIRIGSPIVAGALQFVYAAPWMSRGKHSRSGLRVHLGSLYSHIFWREPHPKSGPSAAR